MGKYPFLILFFLLCPILMVAQDNVDKHVVKSGETISSICKQYGITVEEFSRINPSVSNFVYVGQEVLIPLVSDTKQSTTSNVTKSTDVIRSEPDISLSNENDIDIGKESKSKTDAKRQKDFLVASNDYIGYILPQEGVKNSFGMSFGLGGGSRYFFSDITFLEAYFDLYYEFSTASVSNSYSGYKTSVESSTGNFGVLIPAKLGLSLGNVIYLRAGGFVQFSLFGHVTTETEVTEGKKTQKNKDTVRFKDIDNLNRLRYGVSFDVTFGGWGVGYTLTYQDGVDGSVNMISLVSYF